jgi:hypothetical protein
MALLDKFDRSDRLVLVKLAVIAVVGVGYFLVMHFFGEGRCIAAGGTIVGLLSCEIASATVRFESLFTTEEKVFTAFIVAAISGLAGIWFWHRYLKPASERGRN